MNQGNDTVVGPFTLDLSTTSTIAVGATPVWAVARPDNQRVYVLTPGQRNSGSYRRRSDTILPSQTNLVRGCRSEFPALRSSSESPLRHESDQRQLFMFSPRPGPDLSGDPNDTPTLLATISMTAGQSAVLRAFARQFQSPLCRTVRVFMLPAIRLKPLAPIPNVGATACIIPLLTVFDARSMTVKPAERIPAVALNLAA